MAVRGRINPGAQRATVEAHVKAMTASAVRIGLQDSDMLRRVAQGWQVRAFLYYEQMGEIWYAAQFYARALAKLELNVKKIDAASAAGAGEEEDVEDARIQGYVTRIQDPGGGRANLLGAYGRLMFLTGEGYLLVTNPREQDAGVPTRDSTLDYGLDSEGQDEGDDVAEETGDDTAALAQQDEADDEPEQWEFLSTDELRPTGSGSFTRFKAPSLNAEEIDLEDDENWEPVPGTAVAYRLWRRHPRYSILADAPMRGILDLCEELLLLTLAVRARAVSRVAGAGLLLVPEEISPPPLTPTGDENPAEDPLLADLTESMVTPISDPGTASAVVPYILRGPAEYLKELRLIELSDPTKLYPETGLRTECIRRMAIGADMPPEALIGTEDSNHWTAWSIDEQTWKAHIQPIAQMLVDDLTAAYLRPAMRADGVANPELYVVSYDASAVINHPDRTKDAKDLWDRLVISDEALRDAGGFTEDSAPDEDEWLQRAGFLMRDSSMAAYGIPAIRANIEPEPGEIVTAQGTDAAPQGGVEKPAESNGTGAPPVPEQQAAPPSAVAASAYGAEVAGAVRVSVQRCRELAGNRLRSRCSGIPEAAALIDGVPAGLVASGLGRERVQVVAAGVTPRELVRGGAAALVTALADFGMDRGEAVALAQATERHAAQTLYHATPAPLP